MNLQAVQAYKQTQVSTASQGELILMLFDGAVRFSTQAAKCITESDIAGAHSKLLKAQDIMAALTSALNMDVGEISQNLYQLYTYVDSLLVKANISKDVEPITEAISLLQELKSMWQEVVEKV